MKSSNKPCIYKATSKTTGLSYIGQTTNSLYQRKKRHFYDCKRPYPLLSKFHKALVDLGDRDFKWEILYEVEPTFSPQKIIDILNEKEVEFIKLFNSFRQGYNSDRGGGSHLKGKKYASKEEKAKARQARRKAKRAKWTREEKREWFLNRRKYHNSPEQKAKASYKRKLKRATMTEEEKRVYREKKNLAKAKRIVADPEK